MLVSLVSLLASSPVLGAPSTHDALVSANGFGVVVARTDHPSGHVLADFRDHLYQQYDATSEPGRDLLYDGYFGLGDMRSGEWLTASGGGTYQNGTGLAWIDRSTDDLAITEWILAPRTLDHPAYVQLLHVRNDGTTTAQPRLFSLHNHHLGDTADDGSKTDAESIWVEVVGPDQAVLGEVGAETGLGMVVVGIGGPDSWTCDRLWERMPVEGVLDGRCGNVSKPWTYDDQVGGFQWTPGPLAPGQEAWVGVVAGFFSGGDAEATKTTLLEWISDRGPLAIKTDEEAAWASWLETAAEPTELTDDERAVFNQALVFLGMGQVREPGAPFGQIPASLPVAAGSDSFSHLWNITWVRDSAYAIAALTAAGKHGDARAALEFLLQGKAGDYAHLVGMDYGLSVCRLYGDGSEWSDEDADGPNVELDNFGLLLWALGGYVAATGDIGVVDANRDVVFDGIADVLVAVTGDDDLVMADSSIWERHWNGNQEHFAYTQAWAIRGLQEAAIMAEALDETARAAEYRDTAERIRSGVCDALIDDEGVLAASAEQLERGEPYLDLAAVDAFNNGSLDAAGPQGQASLAAWAAGLQTAAGGFKRNDDGDLYDEQEWIWADLRLAQARRRACDEAGARALEDRVTAYAIANHWTIPELLDPDDGSYAGPAPMMGFGSGLYVLSMFDRQRAREDCEDGVGNVCVDSGGDSGSTGDGGSGDGGSTGDGGSGDGGSGDGGATDGGSTDGGGDDQDGKDGGCGCAAGGGGGSLLVLAGLPLLALRRRRLRRWSST